MTAYPDKNTAFELWKNSMSTMDYPYLRLSEYAFHTMGIAETAALIAQKCHIDESKAFVLGLLHDYGKRQNETTTGLPHFIDGYREMTKLGYTDVARICLTHSFPEPDFAFSDYSSYSEKYLAETKKIISEWTYDIYDKLIQLCDIFFEGNTVIPYQERIAHIRQRYNLNKDQTAVLERKAAENKEYFDNLCQADIYQFMRFTK
jgi:hypothetical protein